MKKILIIFTVFAGAFAFFSFSYKGANAAAASVCSFPRGGATYAGYGAVCLKPNDYSDAIAQLALATGDISSCQVYQDDSQWKPSGGCPSQITYKSKGPRGVTCTYVDNFCSGNSTCTCSDGSTCAANPLSNLMPVSTSPTAWNFAECSKCNDSAFSATWNQAQGFVTVNASAENWRPILHNQCIGHCNEPDNQQIWDTYVDLPQSYLDFKFQVYESGNTTPIIPDVNVFPNSATPTNMNCVYHSANTASGWNPGALAYGQRNVNDHYTTCSVSNVQITGITFQPGKTYTVKTLIKPHYADDTQWIDYVPEGATGKNTNICNDSLTTIQLSPTPTGMPVCENLTTSAQPLLGTTFAMTCEKSASYIEPVTYDFRLIQKENAQSTDPNPLPTPFSQGVTSPVANYSLPANGYGYYLFQCRVCTQGGAFCTAWQNPGEVVPTATPTLAEP